MNWSQEDYESFLQRRKDNKLAAPKKTKQNKFRNKRVKYDDIWFDSQRERDRYIDLKLLEAGGHIHGLEVHPKYVLLESFVTAWGEKVQGIKYKPDFRYTENGRVVVEDVKISPKVLLKEYVIKKKWFMSIYKDVLFREIFE